MLALYSAATDAEVRASTSKLLANQVFSWPTPTSREFEVTRVVLFLRAPPVPKGSDVIEKEHAGGFCGAGVSFAFGSLDAWQWDWTNADMELSREMTDACAPFLRAGNLDDGQEYADAWPALKSISGLIKN